MAQYLVGINGGPWTISEAMTVTLAFRVAETLDLFNPFAVRQIELLGTNGSTILATKSGVDITTPSIGLRRVTFSGPATVGTYYVRAYFTPLNGNQETFAISPAELLTDGADVIAGVISVADLKADYLGVIDDDGPGVSILQDPSGRQLIPDRMIAAAIRRNALTVERLLETNLTPKRYACRPELGVTPLVLGEDYDVEEDAYPWLSQRSTLRSGKITLRHVPLVTITRIRMIYGSRVLYTVPTTWATVEHRLSTVELVLDGSGTFENNQQVAFTMVALNDFLGGSINRNVIPNFWAIDYEAGLAQAPLDVIEAVAWRAVAEILGVAAIKANKTAQQSQSISMDGISRSASVADSQPGGRFARLLQMPQILQWTDNDKLRKDLRPYVRASVRVL